MKIPTDQSLEVEADKPSAPSRVGIVIVNWNGWRDTEECLRSLLVASYPCMDIIVLDNGSADGSWDRLKSFCVEESVEHRLLESGQLPLPTHGPGHKQVTGCQKTVHLIRADRNLGLCGGSNLGLEYSDYLGCEHFLILNNDTVCTPGFLEPLVETAESGDRAGLVGGLIVHCGHPDTVWWAGGTFDRFLETRRVGDGRLASEYAGGGARDTDWVSGCMTLIPAAVYRQVGGFDERFFIWSEEWDLSLRVRSAGYKLYIDPRSRICHKVGRSLGVMKPLSYYYGTRNRLLLKHKHLATWRRLLFLSGFLPTRVLRYLLFLVTGRGDLARAGFDAVWDYFAGRSGIWIRQQRQEERA